MTADTNTAATQTREHPERLWGGHTGRLLLSLSLVWAALQTGRFLLSPLLPTIISDLGLTEATAGVALGAFQLMYAVTQFPSGRISDRCDRPAMVVGGIIVLILAFVLFLGATSPAVFLLSVVILGVGKGLFAIPSRAQLSDLFVKKRGQALGVYSAGTDVGGLLASLIGVVVTGGTLFGVQWLAVGVSWRVAFVPVVLALVLVGGAYVTWNTEPYRIELPQLGLVAALKRLAMTGAQREALVAFSLFSFVVGAWVNFLPAYLVATKGFSEATAAGVFAVGFIIGFLAKPAAGRVADRTQRRGVAVAGLVIAAAALGGIIVAQQLPVVVAAIAVYSLGYKAVFPVVDVLLLDAAPDANVGGDLGAARAAFLGVGAVGPVYLGWTVDTVGYRAGFLGLGVCLLVAAVLLARGLRRPAA